MTKSFKCADVGKDCGWSTSAPTESELIQQITEHAEHEHNIHEIPQELMAEVEYFIKND